jgi:AcrR family transcriptional regulator
MPRRIDADARRREIAALAASLVARRGTDGLSLRALAAAAGPARP